MSDKQASIALTALYEFTGEAVGVSAVVDFINPGNVYLSIGGGEAIALPDSSARQLAEFILRETREHDRPIMFKAGKAVV